MDERIILRSPGPVEVLVGFFVAIKHSQKSWSRRGEKATHIHPFLCFGAIVSVDAILSFQRFNKRRNVVVLWENVQFDLHRKFIKRRSFLLKNTGLLSTDVIRWCQVKIQFFTTLFTRDFITSTVVTGKTYSIFIRSSPKTSQSSTSLSDSTAGSELCQRNFASQNDGRQIELRKSHDSARQNPQHHNIPRKWFSQRTRRPSAWGIVS